MIDWTRVRVLREEIGPDDFDEVIAMFMEEADEVVDRISAGGGLSCDLHFLKGSALNIGFRELAALCASTEVSLEQGTWDPASPAQVAATYLKSRAAFVSGLAGVSTD